MDLELGCHMTLFIDGKPFREEEKQGFVEDELCVISWNVNGLSDEKKCNGDFRKIVNNYDIVFLYETWSNLNSIINLNGFKG